MQVSGRAQDRSFRFGKFVAVLLTVLIILYTPLSSHADFIQTIGDFLSLGANTVRELQDAIRVAGGETRETLETLEQTIGSVMDELSNTYQDNLNVTLDSLDSATRDEVLQLEAVMTRVNDQIQADIRLASSEAQAVIADASLQAQRLSSQIREDVQGLVVVGSEAAVYVIDQTANNILVIVSVVMLGIGLMVFALNLRKRGLLSKILMFVYLIVFGVLIFVPVARAFVLTSAGVGLGEQLSSMTASPRVFTVRPETVILGETSEIEVWGNHLLDDGRAPTARVDGRDITLNAFSEDLLVLDATALGGSTRSTNLELVYGDDTVRTVLNLEAPPPELAPADLTITSFTLSPSSPERGENVVATVVIRNTGETDANGFVIRWEPVIGSAITRASSTLNLASGATRTVRIDGYTYNTAGSFQSRAEVDYARAVTETNESNNTAVRSITVNERQASVTVIFDRVTVIDDANDFGCTGIWMTFSVNSQERDWYSRGSQANFCDGDDKRPNKTFTVTLQEGETLSIRADGRRAHAGFEGAMNAIRNTYRYSSSDFWGAGTGTTGEVYTKTNNRNTNGGFEYEIEYRIIFNGWS